MNSPWHASPEMLRRYANGPRSDVQASSVEAHLLECSRCREAVAGEVAPARIAALWTEVVDRIDVPKAGPVEHLLRWLGLRSHVARLLAATPSLRLSWLVAMSLTLAFAVVAAYRGSGDAAVFLLVAPVLPVAGVAAAYGPGVDPTYEIGTAAPMSSFRLVLLRATAVLTTSVLLSSLAAVAMPVHDAALAAWLLPALGLTIGTLALSTFFPPVWAAGALGAAWATVAITAIRLSVSHGYPLDEAVRRFVAFRPAGQVAFLVATVVALIVVVIRHDTLELGREL